MSYITATVTVCVTLTEQGVGDTARVAATGDGGRETLLLRLPRLDTRLVDLHLPQALTHRHIRRLARTYGGRLGGLAHGARVELEAGCRGDGVGESPTWWGWGKYRGLETRRRERSTEIEREREREREGERRVRRERREIDRERERETERERERERKERE